MADILSRPQCVNGIACKIVIYDIVPNKYNIYLYTLETISEEPIHMYIYHIYMYIYLFIWETRFEHFWISIDAQCPKIYANSNSLRSVDAYMHQ